VKIDETLERLKAQIDKMSAGVSVDTKPRPVLEIVGDREPNISDIKAVGARISYLASRLGCKPYPLDIYTDKPYKRGIYVSDGDAQYDLIEIFNRILDYAGAPE